MTNVTIRFDVPANTLGRVTRDLKRVAHAADLSLRLTIAIEKRNRARLNIRRATRRTRQAKVWKYVLAHIRVCRLKSAIGVANVAILAGQIEGTNMDRFNVLTAQGEDLDNIAQLYGIERNDKP